MSTSREDFGIAVRSALLKKGARQKFSLFFLFIISTIIFFLDFYNVKGIKFTKNIISDGLYRVSNIATSPLNPLHIPKMVHLILFLPTENKFLKDEIERLKEEFQVEYLTNQNDNLKKILESDTNTLNESTLAKVLIDKNSPFLKSIILNRGSSSGIAKGMPVLDGNYLVGRIVEVNFFLQEYYY